MIFLSKTDVLTFVRIWICLTSGFIVGRSCNCSYSILQSISYESSKDISLANIKRLEKEKHDENEKTNGLVTWMLLSTKIVGCLNKLYVPHMSLQISNISYLLVSVKS